MSAANESRVQTALDARTDTARGKVIAAMGLRVAAAGQRVM